MSIHKEGMAELLRVCGLCKKEIKYSCSISYKKAEKAKSLCKKCSTREGQRLETEAIQRTVKALRKAIKEAKNK